MIKSLRIAAESISDRPARTKKNQINFSIVQETLFKKQKIFKEKTSFFN
jgi:hypothetical protein